jgi:ABC-type nitrate/sulfonate/bicarbonate transport system ATPase subunit
MLEVAGLQKKFASGAVPLFDGFDLCVGKGERVGILGRSGCGKTTLARIICGLDLSYTGTVNVNGTPVTKPNLRHQLMTQNLGLYDWLDVSSNVNLGGMLHPELRCSARSETLIETVGLSLYRKHYPAQLSSGQKQRVAFARLMAINPELVVLDEPVSSLDEFTKTSVLNCLLEIHDRSTTTLIFISHNLSEIAMIADRVVILDCDGPTRIVAEMPSPYAGWKSREELLFKDPLNFRDRLLSALKSPTSSTTTSM